MFAYRCMHLTVAMSIEAVASSMIKMLLFRTNALARQNSCRWPWLKFSPPSVTIASTRGEKTRSSKRNEKNFATHNSDEPVSQSKCDLTFIKSNFFYGMGEAQCVLKRSHVEECHQATLSDQPTLMFYELITPHSNKLLYTDYDYNLCGNSTLGYTSIALNDRMYQHVGVMKVYKATLFKLSF